MNNILFIGGIGFQEELLIALVVLLFFCGKKIPELMKGLGKGVRSFKEGLNDKDNVFAIRTVPALPFCITRPLCS